MPEPVLLMGAVTIASSLFLGGSIYKAARAGAELEQLQQGNPVGDALRHAFDVGDDVPADMEEQLAKLS